jgi:hypothetical protein
MVIFLTKRILYILLRISGGMLRNSILGLNSVRYASRGVGAKVSGSTVRDGTMIFSLRPVYGNGVQVAAELWARLAEINLGGARHLQPGKRSRCRSRSSSRTGRMWSMAEDTSSTWCMFEE